MNEDFDISDVHSTFDFKSFLFKLISYWPLFLISLAIGFSIAFYINVRKLPIYQMDNMISIKDDQNPFFTTNTSLTFNWGGTTDKVNTSIITLRSRSHNEKVVERLQFYLKYYKDGKYQQVDAYKNTPFIVDLDTSKFQIPQDRLHLHHRCQRFFPKPWHPARPDRQKCAGHTQRPGRLCGQENHGGR